MEVATGKRAAIRIAAACAVAGLWALGSYLLVEWVRPDSGVVSVSFAMIQPAAICSFIAWVGDPFARRGRSFYLAIPLASAAGMIAVSLAVLREGAICVAMLSPLWILFGLAGSLITYRLRRRARVQPDAQQTFLAHGLLALPLVIMPLEAALPVPHAQYTVTDSIIINAPADEIWPLMRGIGRLRPGEGRWNVSQNILRLPRPLEATLHGSGPGAVRRVRWERGVAFREVVDRWVPGSQIGWRFDFAGSTGWEITDPHLRPDGRNLQILSGGYTLEPLGDGQNRLVLETHYVAATQFNAYAAIWGEVLLGDIQRNVLAGIKSRAEGAH